MIDPNLTRFFFLTWLYSFALLVGLAPKVFAPDAHRFKKNAVPANSLKISRDWAVPSPTLQIFTDWSISQNAKTSSDWAVHTLARLLALPDPKSRAKKNARQQYVGPVAQILRVKELFEAEVDCLKYDFLGMHFRCLELWREIKRELNEYFILLKGPNYLDEEEVCMLLGLILEASVRSRKFVGKLAYPPSVSPDIAIHEATQIMKKFILKYGGKAGVNSEGQVVGLEDVD